MSTDFRSTVNTLYLAHYGWLVSWLRRKLACGGTAADLAQDTFVKLLTHDTLPELREPRAYLTTIAQRVLANHYRRAELEAAWLDAQASLPEAVAMSPEARTLILETLLEIDSLLDGLPGPVRQAFLMAQLDGASHAEIAAELAVSLTTVKRYLARAALRVYFLR